MDILDFLKLGRAYLLEHGWTQKQIYDPTTGAVCTSGALMGAWCQSEGRELWIQLAQMRCAAADTVPLPGFVHDAEVVLMERGVWPSESLEVVLELADKMKVAKAENPSFALATVLKYAPSWNDLEGRTQEQVIAAFDRAIESLEAEREPERELVAVAA